MRLNDRTNQAFRRFRMGLFVLFMLAAAGVLSIGLLRQSGTPGFSDAPNKDNPFTLEAGNYHFTWQANPRKVGTGECHFVAALRTAGAATLVQDVANQTVSGRAEGSFDYQNPSRGQYYMDVATDCEWGFGFNLTELR